MAYATNPNTMVLPTHSARALFVAEVMGQLSDGYWENTRPMNHWRYWFYSDISVGIGPSIWTGRCEKNNYNIVGLMNLKYGEGGYVLRGRMLKIGRLGKALGANFSTGDNHRCAAEYMPETLQEFLVRKETNDWQYDFLPEYMNALTLEQVTAYYETSYTEKDLRNDLRAIKAAMKTAPHWRD